MISDKQVRRYCCEEMSKIENYEVARNSNERWDCHHRGEILPCGRFSPKDLVKFDLYWHRPASELIFLPHSEHQRMHTIGKSRVFTEDHKSSLSKVATERNKGRFWWHKGGYTRFCKTCPGEGWIIGRGRK